MSIGYWRPSRKMLRRIKIISQTWPKTWKEYLKRQQLELPVSTDWKKKENSSVPSLMLMTQLPNPNLTTSMDASTLWLMVSTEQLMLWSPERRCLSVDMEMSEKDAPNPWEVQELEFMWLRLIQFVPFRHAWKDMRLWELKMSLTKWIFSSLPQETEISSRLTIWLKWKITLSLETLVTLIMKLKLKSLKLFPTSPELTSSPKSTNSHGTMDTPSFSSLKVFFSLFRTFTQPWMCHWSPLLRYEQLFQQSNLSSTRTLEQQKHSSIRKQGLQTSQSSWRKSCKAPSWYVQCQIDRNVWGSIKLCLHPSRRTLQERIIQVLSW